MKKEILLGVILLNAMLIANNPQLNEDNNRSKTENNQTKKLVINLDEEQEDAEERGVVEDIIKGIIPLGHNDEVTFLGKDVLIATPIKVYINDIYQEAIKVIDGVFTIKASKLKDGDKVTIKNKKGNIVVEKRVEK
jgi:hypothetical protein